MPGLAAIARLIAYAVNDQSRWRLFVFFGPIVAVGRWLLTDGGIQVLRGDFSPAGITRQQ